MKKWMTVLVALMLALSMVTASAAGVPSKGTGDTSSIVEIAAVSGEALPDDFVIEIVPDKIMTIDMIKDMRDFVKEGNIIDYYAPEVQNDILNHLNANKANTEVLTLDDMKDWVANEIVTLEARNYKPSIGDVTVTFEFATPYAEGQRVVAVLDCFNGQRVEVEPDVFEFVSEKIVLDAEVMKPVDGKGRVAVTFPGDVIVKMEDSVANGLTILSEPMAD